MLKLSRFFIISICILMVTIMLVGCAPDEGADETGDEQVEEPVEEMDNNVIPIGYVAPFTGTAAEFGTNGWRGVEIAVDEVNEQGIEIDGETYQIEIIRYDSICEPTEGVAAVHKMIMEDEVVAFLGDHCSSVCMSIAPLADEYKVPGITIECAAKDVTSPGSPFYFRMRPDMGLMTPMIAGRIYESIKPESISFLSVNDDYGISWTEEHSEAFAEFGVETLSEQYFERGTSDFSVYLSKIRDEAPDMVGYVGVTPEGAMILEQAEEMGLAEDIAFYGAEEMSTYEMLDLTSPAVLEGTYAVALWAEAPADLEREVRERYDAPLHYAIIFGYDAVYVLADAISRAQSLDPVDIRDALKEGTYDTLAGFTEFKDFDDYMNQGEYTPYLVKWEDGEMVLSD
jgi:branched-chain amino acid transport system substrate-binding protein